MSELPFKKKLKLKRDFNGEWELPPNLTEKARQLLKEIINQFGHIINVREEIDLTKLAERMRDNYDNIKVNTLANELMKVEALTMVVYDGDHRKSDRVVYQHTVTGADLDDAETLIDQVTENEIVKNKYKDGIERRTSVFVMEGGELKSGVFKFEAPKNVNDKKLKLH